MKSLKLIFLFWLSLCSGVLFFLPGCSISSQEKALMQAMLKTQEKQVKKQAQEIFGTYNAFQSEYILDYVNTKDDLRILAKAEKVHNQVKKAVMAADTLIRHLENTPEASIKQAFKSRFFTDTVLQKLETDYHLALRTLKKKQLAEKGHNMQTLQYLNKINGFTSSGKAGFVRVQELRSQQLDLLITEELLLQQLGQYIGFDGIRCYFGSGGIHVLSASILQKDQQVKVLIGPSAQWRTDKHNYGTHKPLLFRLNGKEQPVHRRHWIPYNDPYYKLVSFPPPGFKSEINIPTSAEDLGQAESVIKTFKAEWLMPVSYFQDSVITMQGQYEIRKKCK